MTNFFRSVAPAFIALTLCLPVKAALACDDKECPHHAEKGSKCECSCPEHAKAKAEGKTHKCGTGSCKMAKCDGKGCKHKGHHEGQKDDHAEKDAKDHGKKDDKGEHPAS
jgi:hypothetical protein